MEQRQSVASLLWKEPTVEAQSLNNSRCALTASLRASTPPGVHQCPPHQTHCRSPPLELLKSHTSPRNQSQRHGCLFGSNGSLTSAWPRPQMPIQMLLQSAGGAERACFEDINGRRLSQARGLSANELPLLQRPSTVTGSSRSSVIDPQTRLRAKPTVWPHGRAPATRPYDRVLLLDTQGH